MKSLKFFVFTIGKFLEISKKATHYLESLHYKLINKQLNIIKRTNYDK